MLAALKSIFWLCLFLVAYTYFLYPILLFLLSSLRQARRDWAYLAGRRDRRTPNLDPSHAPSVTLIVAAYNEESSLAAKLQNVADLLYPAGRLQVIFVSDGSTDRTNQILQSVGDARATSILLPARGGKSTALNHGVSQASGEILVFTDCTTLLAPDAISKLVRHFADPAVGAVCGLLDFSGTTESRNTEGVYWKYERMLRLMEARLGATLTASGALYALRRSCYRPVSPEVLIDDFVIPMEVRRQGFRVLYDPDAVAREFAAHSVGGEFKRRVRLTLGGFRAFPTLLSARMDAVTWFSFVSHKLFRWLAPLFFIGLLLSNLLLLDSLPYAICMWGQVAFYLWAAIGALFHRHLQGVRFALLAYFLSAMNLALLIGFFQSLRKRRVTSWERAA